MNWSEHAIGRVLAQQSFNRKYLVVVPNCNWTCYEGDVLAITDNFEPGQKTSSAPAATMGSCAQNMEVV